MSVKAKVEAIIYATEDPVTLNQLASLLKDTVLAEMRAEEEARLALNEVVADARVAETNEGDELADELLIEDEESGVEDVAPPADATDQEGSSYLQGKQLKSTNLRTEE